MLRSILFAAALLAGCGSSAEGAGATTSGSSSTAGSSTAGSSTAGSSTDANECPAGQVMVAGSCEPGCETNADCSEGLACIEDTNADERDVNEDGTIGPLLEPVRYCGVDD